MNTMDNPAPHDRPNADLGLRLPSDETERLRFLLRQVFFARLPLGEKVEEFLDPQLWRWCYEAIYKEDRWGR